MQMPTALKCSCYRRARNAKGGRGARRGGTEGHTDDGRRGSDSAGGGHSFDEHGLSLLFFWSLPGLPPLGGNSPQQLSPAPPGLGRAREAGTGDEANSAASRAGVAFWVRLRFMMARLLAKAPNPDPRAQSRGSAKTGHKLSLAGGAAPRPANCNAQARTRCGASHPSQAGLHCDAILTPVPSSPIPGPPELLLSGNGHPPGWLRGAAVPTDW